MPRLLVLLLIALPALAHNVVDVAVDQRAPAYIASGATLNYTIVINDLAYDLGFGIVVTDQLPAGATFKSATGTGWNCSQSKGTVTCSAEQILPGTSLIAISLTAPATTGTIHNQASVDSLGTIDPVTTNNAKTFDTFVYNASSCSTAAPSLISPDDQSTLTGSSAHFDWTRVSGATRYRVYTALEGAKPALVGESTTTSLDADLELGSNEVWVDAVFDSCPPVSSAHEHVHSSATPRQFTATDLATSKSFTSPASVGADSYGNLYVLDAATSTIEHVESSLNTTVVAGQSGVTGSTDGPGTIAQLNHPLALSVTAGGYAYIADSGNGVVRQYYPAGNGIFFGPLLGTLAAPSHFNAPAGIVATPAYNYIISDTANNAIRELDRDLTMKTLAASVSLKAPTGLTLDDDGNLYIADTGNNIIRKLGTDGSVVTIAGTEAQLNQPTGLALDALGNLYVADTGNHSIRRIAPSGLVTTILTGLGTPTGLAFDLNGRLLIADRDHAMIRVAIPGGFAPPPTTTVPAHRRAAGH